MIKVGKALLAVLVLLSPSFSMAGGDLVMPPKTKPNVLIYIAKG